jgi:hypothetical protein
VNLAPPPYSGTEGVRCIDAKIEPIVRILYDNGIETTESCQGGDGHSFHEPTVCFTGEYEAGFRALAVALAHGLKVSELRRKWNVVNGEPRGPEWEMIFVL